MAAGTLEACVGGGLSIEEAPKADRGERAANQDIKQAIQSLNRNRQDLETDEVAKEGEDDQV